MEQAQDAVAGIVMEDGIEQTVHIANLGSILL